MIKCYRVLVKKQNDKLTITSLSLPSFFLCEGACRDFTDFKVTHLKWMSSEDSLLVGMKCSTGSFMELWGLVEKSTPIHRQFQSQNKTEIYKVDVCCLNWNLISLYLTIVFFRFGPTNLTIATPARSLIFAPQNFNTGIRRTSLSQCRTTPFIVFIRTHLVVVYVSIFNVVYNA